MKSQRSRPLFRVPDAGWLYLVAGLALLATTYLIPAQDRLRETRYQRDRAISLEKHHEQRVRNYGEFLDRLASKDEPLVRSLAIVQLNRTPPGTRAVLGPDPHTMDAGVLSWLEPVWVEPPPPPTPDSKLYRLASAGSTRLWIFVIGATLVLIGLLPRSGSGRGSACVESPEFAGESGVEPIPA
ncbi:MAG: hypothetical protein AAGD00_00325 [Planctomycetota bacterium]